MLYKNLAYPFPHFDSIAYLIGWDSDPSMVLFALYGYISTCIKAPWIGCKISKCSFKDSPAMVVTNKQTNQRIHQFLSNYFCWPCWLSLDNYQTSLVVPHVNLTIPGNFCQFYVLKCN